jgi:pyrroloquinoline-quinone synthase
MDAHGVTIPWSGEELERRIHALLAERYHHVHPFNQRMHDGALSPAQIRGWIANRFYYQERIPIKDAVMLSKLPWQYRREWIRRIIDHDGTGPGEGGLEAWLRLGEAAGLSRADLLGHRLLLPAARFACDAYVNFVRDHSWLEGIASSLTELSAPSIMGVRIAAFEAHYRWVRPEGLDYFRSRVVQGARDASFGLPVVLEHARTPQEQQAVLHRSTQDAQAYDAYLRGLVAANKMGEGALDEAVRCFEEATKLDPSFAEAYAAWANQYVVAAGDSLPMREVMPRARALAARALELNPNSSDAHAALGNIALQFDTDWKRAESEFREAIALNSSNLNAHRFLGLLLLCQERFPEAKEVLRRTIQLDPAGTGRTTLAFAELESGNVDAAIAFGEAERDADPSAVRVHVYLGFFYVAAGRRDDALREAMSSTTGASEDDRFDHALLNALVGRPEPARKILVQVARGELNTYVSDTHLAMVYSALGEKERALDLLEKDYREGDRILWLFHRSVVFDAIRDEPRFIALAKKYGLPGPTRRATHKRATAA